MLILFYAIWRFLAATFSQTKRGIETKNVYKHQICKNIRKKEFIEMLDTFSHVDKVILGSPNFVIKSVLRILWDTELLYYSKSKIVFFWLKFNIPFLTKSCSYGSKLYDMNFGDFFQLNFLSTFQIEIFQSEI